MTSHVTRTASQVVALAAVAAGCVSGLVGPAGAQSGDAYRLEYITRIGDGDTADVTLRVEQSSRALRRVRINASGAHFRDFRSDDALERDGDDIVWRVGDNGGSVRWRAALQHRRSDGSFDAMRGPDWVLLRTEDLFPPMGSVTRVGASADTTMRFELPAGWSIVTPYREDDGVYAVEDENRRFDHPDGWIVAGDIGVRYDRIANTTVAVAAPRDQSARRLDVMAFLNWHLAHVRGVLPDFPPRLLVAMAGDPFFRGGLSAPNSLFLHTDRPLLSGNGTSTLLHELIHVGLSRSAGPDEDWIVEGFAEFYSQELLYRAGTVTRRRHQDTLRELRDWGKDVKSLRGDYASGPVTARAAVIFNTLDAEMRRRTDGRRSLDDLVRRLAAADAPLTLELLRSEVRDLIGRNPEALANANLPGYR